MTSARLSRNFIAAGLNEWQDKGYIKKLRRGLLYVY